MYTVIQNGDQVTIPVYARNNGTGIEPNALITISVPTGMSLVSATPNKGTFTDPIWNVGSLNPGDEFRMDVVLEVTDLAEAPFLFSYSISGEAVDGVAANDAKTVTIEAVNDLFSATANDDSNLSMSFDLSENDVPCNYCETKWTITAPSVTNGTIIAFDQTTGKGEFRFDDPTVDASFEYTISCYNCGDGVTYDQDTAMATFPALFDGAWIPAVGGDVSTMTNNPSGTDVDVYRHTAGGVDTDFDTGKYKLEGGVFEVSTNNLNLQFKDSPDIDVDLSGLVSHTTIQNIFLTGNVLHIVEGSGITSNEVTIDLTPILPVNTDTTNASFSLVGTDLVLTDSEADTVSADVSSIVVTGIAVDESAAPTKTITLTFADGSTISGSFTDDSSAGGGDNWGSQVVQSDVTLSGDGTGGNPLSVDSANNPMVANFEINGTNDLVLTLTDGTVITLTNAAMKSAFDTDTDTTILTDVTLVGNELRITDDSGVKTVDLTPLIVTTLGWASITGKPTLTENGGNVTGFINLSTEEFALTSPDTNNYVTAGSIPIPSNGQLVLERLGLSDVLIDLSSLQNTPERFALTQTVIDMDTAIHTASNVKNNSAVVVPYDGKIVSFSFSFVNFEGTGVVNIGGVPAGDVGDKRVVLIHNDQQNGRDVTNGTETDVAHISVAAGHRKEVRLPSQLTVQAGDVIRFDLVNDSDGSAIGGSLSTEGFITTVHMEIDETNNGTNTATATAIV